ncbi:MFS transporter [Vibrio sonorensis]|uniref:MFS transporter n=1 Tax=Vibrio sonorensis TaxID=1004316 RepID=UPI0008D985B6|nr:MFS transporter [Vibrio sonorensis]
MLACLYLVQGIPLGLAFQAFPTLLRHEGLSLDLIALTPIAALPWVLKVFWAPLIDNYWSVRVGRRRSWIIPLQILSAICLFLIASIELNAHSAVIVLSIISLLALFSSTQDIATDGLTAERAKGSKLGQANSVQVAFFMAGMIVGSSGVLIGEEYLGHFNTFMAIGVLQILCVLPVVFWREPEPNREDLVNPGKIRKVFSRPYSLHMLGLALFTTMGGAGLFGLIKLILVDSGWSMTQIGFISGLGHNLMVIAGCIIVTPLIQASSVWRAQTLGLMVLILSGVGWYVICSHGYLEPWAVWTMTILTGLSIGMNTVAAYTLVMGFARTGTQPAVDIAGYQASQTLSHTLIGMIAIGLASVTSYASASLLAIPISIIALWFVYRCKQVN